MNRIRTRTRGPLARGADALWRKCEQNQALPLAVVTVLLAIVGAFN